MSISSWIQRHLGTKGQTVFRRPLRKVTLAIFRDHGVAEIIGTFLTHQIPKMGVWRIFYLLPRLGWKMGVWRVFYLLPLLGPKMGVWRVFYLLPLLAPKMGVWRVFYLLPHLGPKMGVWRVFYLLPPLGWKMGVWRVFYLLLGWKIRKGTTTFTRRDRFST